jgi:integrase
MEDTKEPEGVDSQGLQQLDNADTPFLLPFLKPGVMTNFTVETNGESAYESKKSRAQRRRENKRRRKGIRGVGSIYPSQWRDKKTRQMNYSPRWTIKLTNRRPELTPFTEERDAWNELMRRHAEIAAGRPGGPDVKKTNFQDLVTMLTNDYKLNGRKSLARLEDAIDHLRGFFDDSRAVNITSDRVTEYIVARQAEKAAASTINTELAALGRMFVLAIRAGKAASKPYIPKLQLNNARKGFFERGQFDAVLANIAEHLRPMLETAFITGWRVHSEILTRQKRHVDLKAGWLRLEPGETKNGDGRMFPLTGRLREILEKQLAETEAAQQLTGTIIPWLFHHDGKQIKHFRRSWVTACVKAGLGRRVIGTDGRIIKTVVDRIPHDFRRTAVRNLERAGVPRSAAMKLIGHKTQAIYSRYAIADEGMLKDAAVKLQQLHVSDKLSATKSEKQSSGKAEQLDEVGSQSPDW